MKTLKSIKKIFAIGAIGVLALGALTGCTQSITQEDMDSAIEQAKAQAYEKGVESVDITSDNVEMEEEIARLNMVIEDAKVVAAEIAEEEANMTTEVEEVEVESEGYDIDDVELDGNFSSVIDNDDLEKLYYVEVEDYEDKDYIVEEKLYVTGDVAPVLNMEDMNGDIVVEIAEKGAVKYMVEFDTGIEFDAASDDAFEIDFLGSPMKIVDYDGDEVTFRLSQSYVLKQDESVEVEGKVVSLKGVNDDGDKVYVTVDGVSKSIDEGEKETINGVEIFVNDVFSGSVLNIAELYIGEDVEDSVQDGDEYEANDDYEWVITEDSNEITGIGLIYNEKLVDDDEVLKLGDEMVLPNEYLTLKFADIKDMEGMDLSLSLNNADIDLEFDGKIEVDGDKIDDAKMTLYINDAGDVAFDYRYKGDKYDNETDLSKIAIINDDREMSLSMNSSMISIYDDDVNYSLDYVFGDEFESVAGTLTANVNDDDDYRVANGDLMYKSELNEAGETEEDFVVALKNQEVVELIMKVE